jgi:flagellar hook-associated protein 3 FlgL
MRVASLHSQLIGLNNMMDASSRLNDLQKQVGTGKRLVSPSDDPAATALTLALKENQNRNTQFNKNADILVGRLGLEDETLGSVTNMIQRARELAVQGSNDTYSDSDRGMIAVEIREIVETVMGLSNGTDANGEFIFAGHASEKPAFVEVRDADGQITSVTYDGAPAQRTLQISDTRFVQLGDIGSAVFQPTKDGEDDIFSTLIGLADNLEANSGSVIISSSLDKINLTIDRISEARARTGIRMNGAEAQVSVNEGLNSRMTEQISGLEDLDYAQAITQLNIETAGLQAAQQAYSRVQGLSLFNFIGG